MITADDVEDELDIHSIAINVTETWRSKDGYACLEKEVREKKVVMQLRPVTVSYEA